MDSVYNGWFIEGVADYASLKCASSADQLNTFFE